MVAAILFWAGFGFISSVEIDQVDRLSQQLQYGCNDCNLFSQLRPPKLHPLKVLGSNIVMEMIPMEMDLVNKRKNVFVKPEK